MHPGLSCALHVSRTCHMLLTAATPDCMEGEGHLHAANFDYSNFNTPSGLTEEYRQNGRMIPVLCIQQRMQVAC